MVTIDVTNMTRELYLLILVELGVPVHLKKCIGRDRQDS